MPENRNEPVTEIRVVTPNGKHRIYRGQNAQHILWKIEEHTKQGHRLERDTVPGTWSHPPLELPK